MMEFNRETTTRRTDLIGRIVYVRNTIIIQMRMSFCWRDTINNIWNNVDIKLEIVVDLHNIVLGS